MVSHILIGYCNNSLQQKNIQSIIVRPRDHVAIPNTITRMETQTTRTGIEIAAAVHSATTEAREVMQAVTDIVQNVNNSINENMATIAAKYNISEKHLRKMAEVRLLKLEPDK